MVSEICAISHQSPEATKKMSVRYPGEVTNKLWLPFPAERLTSRERDLEQRCFNVEKCQESPGWGEGRRSLITGKDPQLSGPLAARWTCPSCLLGRVVPKGDLKGSLGEGRDPREHFSVRN